MVTHISASQIKTFRSCNKKWWLEKVACVGERHDTPSTLLGKAVHTAIEEFFKSNTSLNLSLYPFLKPSLPWLESVKDRVVGVEVEFRERGLFTFETIGYIDLVLDEGEYIHVIDHKTTKSFYWCKSELELLSDPQAQLYALVAYRRYGKPVRFSHNYICTQAVAEPRLVTCVFKPEEILRAVIKLASTVEQIEAVALIQNEGAVEPSYDFCNAFGGCPFRTRCDTRPRQDWLSLVGDLYE